VSETAQPAWMRSQHMSEPAFDGHDKLPGWSAVFIATDTVALRYSIATKDPRHSLRVRRRSSRGMERAAIAVGLIAAGFTSFVPPWSMRFGYAGMIPPLMLYTMRLAVSVC